MSVIRPSKASIWVLCPGSAHLQALHPEQPGDNEVREEGTAGHWAAYEIGNGRAVPVGTVAPVNGVELTEDILDAVQEYLAVLFGWGTPVYMETPLAVPSIHEECDGTVDAWSWDEVNRVLRVADLKLGYRQVDPFENWQLLAYLRGVLDLLKLDAHFTFELIIVQPRAYGHQSVKVWRGYSSTLAPYFDKLRRKAHHAVAVARYGDDAGQYLPADYGQPYTAGPHCDGCSAAGHCATLHNSAMAVVDLSGCKGDVLQSVNEVAQRLRRLDRAAETLAAEIAGLEARLEHEIVANHIAVPFFEVSPGAGKKVWRTGTEQQVIATGHLLGVELAKPQKPLTVVQANAALKNVAPGVLDAYVERQPGKTKLRRVAENSVRKLFEGTHNAV